MKLYNILLLFCLALLLSSCFESQPEGSPYTEYLCVINSDGTGFQKLMRFSELPLITHDFWDLYVTQAGKLIFAADKYYITDPDTINLIPFTSEITGGYRGMTFSNDNKAYYCLNGDLYKYDFQTQITQNLTENDNRAVIDPRISSDDNIIMFRTVTNSLLGTAAYFRISTDSLYLVPELGNSILNIAYNSSQQKIYYEQADGLYRSNLDGSDITHIAEYAGSWIGAKFNLTNLNDHIITLDSVANLDIINILTNTIEYTTPFNISNDSTPKCCKSTNKVFYVIDGNIFYYDLDLQSAIKVPNVNTVRKAACPTWDGSKIYFISSQRAD
jgi:hypothetical protein